MVAGIRQPVEDRLRHGVQVELDVVRDHQARIEAESTPGGNFK
jgi:hypothetical protein